MASVFIETQRLILRQWNEKDHEPYIEMNCDREVMEFFPSVLSRAETIAQIGRMTDHIEHYGYGFFAMERKDNHQFIGFTGLSHPRFEAYFMPCIEIGWRLSKENWNHGFATEAAKACLDFGLNKLDLGLIYAFTSVYNFRSEQVMIKAGMTKEGLFEHPSLQEGHFLRKHVLYKMSKTIN